MFTIDHTRELTELLADAAVWNRLAMGIPFRETSWLRPWWHCNGREDGAFVLVANNGEGCIEAILPLYRTGAGGGGRVLSMIGDGPACSDYVSGLARPGRTGAIGRTMGKRLAQLAGHAEHGWEMIDIDGVCDGDAFLLGLARGLRDGGATLHLQSRVHTWFRPAEATWDAHIKSHGKTQRRKLRKWSRLQQQCPQIEHRVASNRDEARLWLEEVIRLHQRRWTGSGQCGSFADPRFVQFIREAAEDFFERDRLYLPTLQINGRVISGEIHFVGGDRRLYFYSGGFDPDHASLEPGRALHVRTWMHVYEDRLAGIDYLRGDETYKKRTGATPSRVLRIRAISPHWLSRLKHAAWCTSFELKQWMRRQTGRPPVDVIDIQTATS
jgi:CelD/BcsL family acetyltransferase involved in cellulose biosynthesis